MNFKIIPAGNLLPYFTAAKNFKGEQREFAPEWLNRAGPRSVPDFINRLAPPHVRKNPRKRRVAHCRQHLAHLIVGFSEGHAAIRPLLPLTLRITECLVAVGLPLDSLHFVWCHHPQTRLSHVHGALLRRKFPFGGHFTPRLRGDLRMDFGWLHSRKLGLSDPLDPKRRRLVSGFPFSYKGQGNRKRIDLICDLTQQAWEAGELKRPEDFRQLLEKQFGPVLAWPDDRGRPVSASVEPLARVFRQAVAVPGVDTPVIWLKGSICRADFSPQRWADELKKQHLLFHSEHRVYARFQSKLLQQLQAQRDTGYRVKDSIVDKTFFEWLDPNHDVWGELNGEALLEECQGTLPGTNIPLPALPPAPEGLAATAPADPAELARLPEEAYPFYSDLEERNDRGMNLDGADQSGDPSEDEFPEAIELIRPDQIGEIFWPFLALRPTEVARHAEAAKNGEVEAEAIKEQNWAPPQAEEDACEVPEVTVSAAVTTTVVVQGPPVDQNPPASAPSPTITDHVSEAPIASPVGSGPTLPEAAETETTGIPPLDGTPAPQSSVEHGGKTDSPILPVATTLSEPVSQPRPAESAGADVSNGPGAGGTDSSPIESSPVEPAQPRVNEPFISLAGLGGDVVEDRQREKLRKELEELEQRRLQEFQDHQRQLGISISLSMAMELEERTMAEMAEMAKSRRAAKTEHNQKLIEGAKRLQAERERKKTGPQAPPVLPVDPPPPPEKRPAPEIPPSAPRTSNPIDMK